MKLRAVYFDKIKNGEKIGFGNMDKAAVKTIYHQFYSVTDEKEYGVVAIKVKVLH